MSANILGRRATSSCIYSTPMLLFYCTFWEPHSRRSSASSLLTSLLGRQLKKWLKLWRRTDPLSSQMATSASVLSNSQQPCCISLDFVVLIFWFSSLKFPVPLPHFCSPFCYSLRKSDFRIECCRLPQAHPFSFQHLHPHTLCSCSSHMSKLWAVIPSKAIPPSGHRLCHFPLTQDLLQEAPACDIITSISFLSLTLPASASFFVPLVSKISKKEL
jgi:hypothetical protein